MIDVGTSSVRAAIVQPDATVAYVHRHPLPPHVPMPGLVEFDPATMAAAAIEMAGAALADLGGPVEAVGVTANEPRPSPGTAAPAIHSDRAWAGRTCAP